MGMICNNYLFSVVLVGTRIVTVVMIYATLSNGNRLKIERERGLISG